MFAFANMGEKFVSRGDYSSSDFTFESYITDYVWRELDLTGIVPANATMVMINMQIKGSGIGESMMLSPYGYTNRWWHPQINIQAANVAMSAVAILPLFGVPKVQYRITPNGWSVLKTDVLGWWI
ncbi:unnamed protein product [marine sediment metagenome]|uniref:Uncharacterized protein n=1 Tax=marine sediment metagenome TaxID=412755 RepID=X1KCW6_9ZZZZ